MSFFHFSESQCEVIEQPDPLLPAFTDSEIAAVRRQAHDGMNNEERHQRNRILDRMRQATSLEMNYDVPTLEVFYLITPFGWIHLQFSVF